MSIRDTYSSDDLARNQTPLEQIAGSTFRFERPFYRKDGMRVEVEVLLSPMFQGGRQAVIHDIGERKRAEELLREHAQQTAAGDRSRSCAYVYLGERCQRLPWEPVISGILRSSPFDAAQ